MDTITLHASCVALGGKGVLLMGEPRMGKSDLCLRLIDRGARLVSDDQVQLRREGDAVIASPPHTIEGLIEVRGVGIFNVQAEKHAPVQLVVQLVSQDWIERLPYPEPYDCMGAPVAQLRLCAFEESAPIKIEMAMAALADDRMKVGAFKE